MWDKRQGKEKPRSYRHAVEAGLSGRQGVPCLEAGLYQSSVGGRPHPAAEANWGDQVQYRGWDGVPESNGWPGFPCSGVRACSTTELTPSCDLPAYPGALIGRA